MFRGKKRRVVVGRKGEERWFELLGLLDRFHAFVVLQRFRQRCRSRVTDAVALETARIANEHTNRKGIRDSVRPKRGCDPGCAAVLWLRGLAYKILFTVLARSPRTASSKFVAVAAIVSTSR